MRTGRSLVRREKELTVLLEIESGLPILTDVAYSSQDQEYADAVALDIIQRGLRAR